MSGQSGFTLIEALATGAISTIVGSAILSVLYMSNAQIQDGSANLRLVQLQGIVSDQIRSDTRKAFGVKRSIDPVGLFVTPELDLAFAAQKEIRICDSMGVVISGYQINLTDSLLYEGKMVAAVMQWTPFRVGEFTIKVHPDSSDFTILERRRGVIINLRYKLLSGGKAYSFPPLAETVVCRNTHL